MADKSWLLNPSAIRVAKKCIENVQNELGVRLKLSHPEFMQMLQEYSELTDSPALAEAYQELLSYVDGGASVTQLKKAAGSDVVQPVRSISNVETVKTQTAGPSADASETVLYNGKSYARWRGDKEFKGLYRGQPRYI